MNDTSLCLTVEQGFQVNKDLFKASKDLRHSKFDNDHIVFRLCEIEYVYCNCLNRVLYL